MQEVQAHSQNFWFGENPGKIPENPGKIRRNLDKICENFRKIPENLGKLLEHMSKNGAQRLLIWKQMAPNVLCFEEMAPNMLFVRKYPHKKWPKKFSGKFGEIRTKILRTPKICLLLHLCTHMTLRAGLRGARGAIAPGPRCKGDPLWWNLFVSNKILVWKISWFRSDTRIQLYIIFLCCVKYPRPPTAADFFTSLTVCHF